METPLEFATITELAAQMRTGAVSPVKLAEASLDRIRALDKRLHAFIAVSADRALAEARAAETLLKLGHDLGPLQGVAYAVKDLYDERNRHDSRNAPPPRQRRCRRLLGGAAARECRHGSRRQDTYGAIRLRRRRHQPRLRDTPQPVARDAARAGRIEQRLRRSRRQWPRADGARQRHRRPR